MGVPNVSSRNGDPKWQAWRCGPNLSPLLQRGEGGVICAATPPSAARERGRDAAPNPDGRRCEQCSFL